MHLFKLNFIVFFITFIVLTTGISVADNTGVKNYRPNKKAQQWYEKGCTYEEIGGVKQAQEAYIKAVEIDPKFNFAIFRLACLYDFQRDFKKSKPLYEQILTNNPNFFLAYNNLAVIEFSEGNTEKAVANWNESLKLEAVQPEIYNNLGLSYLIFLDNETALKYFDMALRFKPSYLQAANNRALTLANLARYKDAEIQYEEMIKQFSYEPFIYYNYALFCISYNNYSRAKHLLGTAIKLKNNSAQLYSALALAQSKSGGLAESQTNIEKALELQEKNVDADRNIGCVYLEKKDFQQALIFLNRAMDINPDDAVTVAALGNVYIALNSSNKALELWQTSLSGDKVKPEILNARAVYYINSGNYSTAMNDLNLIISNTPNDFNALFLIGKINELQNNDIVAIDYYMKAADSCPYFAESSNCAAMLYSKQGNNRKATEILSTSIEIKPDYADSYSNLGLVYSRMNNSVVAVTTWMQGLSIDGQYAPIYYHLACENMKMGQKDEALRYFQTYLRLAPEGKFVQDVYKRIMNL